MRNLKKTALTAAAVGGLAIVLSGCNMNVFGGGQGGGQGGGAQGHGIWHCTATTNSSARQYHGRSANKAKAQSLAMNSCQRTAPRLFVPSCQHLNCQFER